MKSKITFGNAVSMEQPDMIHFVKNYHSEHVKDQYISNVYSFCIHEGAPVITTAIQDASTDLIFYREMNGDSQGILLVGPAREMTKNYITFFDETEYFGVRFKPGIALDFGKIHTSELYGQILNMQCDELIQLNQQLASKQDLAEKIMLIRGNMDQFVKQRDDTKTMITNNIIDLMIQNKSNIKLEELAKYMGYTSYYLNKVFHAHTGYSIGKYHSLIRCHAVLNEYERLRDTSFKVDQSAIAFKMGYSDQAHMIREFKKYLGITPSQYWRRYYGKNL